MKPLIEKLLSLPKSFYVSLRYFPLAQAIHLPILVRYNTKLLCLKGNVQQIGGGKKSRLIIGFGKVGTVDAAYERSIIQIGGTLTIKGKVNLGTGSKLCVTRNGTLTIGDNFINTAKTTIICDHQINIGNNVLVSWDTLIMDTDWHPVMNTETHEVYPMKNRIVIGDNVWLGCRAVVLKGANIPNGCVVGANSLVNRAFCSENTLLAGNPAIEKRHNISRKTE